MTEEQKEKLQDIKLRHSLASKYAYGESAIQESIAFLLSLIDSLTSRVKELELDKQAIQTQLDVINSCEDEVKAGNDACGICRTCARKKVKELEVENRSLQAQTEEWKKQTFELHKEYDTLQSQLDRVREVADFAEHKQGCRALAFGQCTCGLSKAMAEAIRGKV